MFLGEMTVPSRFNDKIERSGEFLWQNNQLSYIQDFTPLFSVFYYNPSQIAQVGRIYGLGKA